MKPNLDEDDPVVDRVSAGVLPRTDLIVTRRRFLIVRRHPWGRSERAFDVRTLEPLEVVDRRQDPRRRTRWILALALPPAALLFLDLGLSFSHVAILVPTFIAIVPVTLFFLRINGAWLIVADQDANARFRVYQFPARKLRKIAASAQDARLALESVQPVRDVRWQTFRK